MPRLANPRRADAERNKAAILEAAAALLGRDPRAGMGAIARAAGVTRQTVYSHFPSREVLLRAAVARATDDAIAALDAARLDDGPAPQALLRLLDATWNLFARQPFLLGAAAELAPQESEALHAPVLTLLERLVRRGQRRGEFDRSPSPTWLVSATVALGHAAGEQVATGGISADAALAALKQTLLRVYGA